MTDLKSIHHTGYTVSNLEQSIAFYCDVLGLEVVTRQEKQGGYLAEIVGHPTAHVRMAHLRVPGATHVVELFEYVAPPGKGPGKLEPPDVGTAHLCFVVDDLQATYERLVAAGVSTFISPPVPIDTGINSGGAGLYLRDPDGIPLEIFQPPRRD